MTYFQNPFNSEFRGNWVLSDRQYSLTFVCPGNVGRSDSMVANFEDPITKYDLSGNDSDGDPTSILSIYYTVSGNFQDWHRMDVDITDNTNAALSPVPVAASISGFEIVAILNAHPTFKSYFTAYVKKFPNSSFLNNIFIEQKFQTSRMKFFIINGGAEEVLKFNKMAGVADIPSYFSRSKVLGGDMTITRDGLNALVELSPANSGGTSVVDDLLIDNAVNEKNISLGLDSNSILEDWQHLKGRASGLFTFQKLTVDVNNRITEIIEYPAGSEVGSFARKIQYTYTGINTNPDQVTEIPYVLTSGDLVTP